MHAADGHVGHLSVETQQGVGLLNEQGVALDAGCGEGDDEVHQIAGGEHEGDAAAFAVAEDANVKPTPIPSP